VSLSRVELVARLDVHALLQQIPNLRGTLVREPTSHFYRPPPNGNADPLSEEELERLYYAARQLGIVEIKPWRNCALHNTSDCSTCHVLPWECAGSACIAYAEGYIQFLRPDGTVGYVIRTCQTCADTHERHALRTRFVPLDWSKP
jgi:hypothetical protein